MSNDPNAATVNMYADMAPTTTADREQTGWERVAHRLPDEIESLRSVIDGLAKRLEPFLRDADVPPSLQEASLAPSGAAAIVHAEEQIDRIRDCRSRIGSLIDRLDI